VFPARGAHHLEDIDSIWRKEKDFWKRITWVLFVGSLASFLVYSGGFYPENLCLGAWHKLEERGVHCRKGLSLFIGTDLHRFS
jgi:hypothetical protein